MKRNTLSKISNPHPLTVSRILKLAMIIAGLTMIGCKAKKQMMANRTPVDTPAVNKPRTVSTIPVDSQVIAKLDLIKKNQVYFNTFTGKAKAKLDMDGSSNDVTLNIRILRDKKIWVSVTAILGVEVARLLITPDSIMVNNKLPGGEFTREPFSFVHAVAGNQVNYKTLESLLVGNPIPELLNRNAKVNIDNGNTALTGALQDLMYKLVFGPDMRTMQTSLSNQDAGQSLQVTNNTFIQVANKVIPSQIDMASLVKDKKIQLNLRYTRVEFDKVQDYPFSIPSKK